MDPNLNENAVNGHEIKEEISEEPYDANRCMSADCRSQYHDNQFTKKIKLEKGIIEDKLAELLPDFHGRIVSTGCTCFIPTPCKANKG